MTDHEAYRLLHGAYEGLLAVVTADFVPQDRGYREKAIRFAAETRKHLNELERRSPDLHEAVLEGRV